MDQSKASDTINHSILLAKLKVCVNHSILLAKLEVYGFSDHPQSLLQSYVRNRFQRSIINGFLGS